MSQTFDAALAAYRAQRYSEAQADLDSLLATNPDSFNGNELMGLVYVAEGHPLKANRYLEKAVQLRSRTASARTALAANLLVLHRTVEAEAQFSKVAQMNPGSFDANHNLGEFYIQCGRLNDAVGPLRRAQEIETSAYDNGYDLALALEKTGQLREAHAQLQSLIKVHDTAELHSLLGEVDERSRDFISSAAEYEQAARMDPNEVNIFNWGAELVLHQAFPAAIEVFRAGLERFPQSGQLRSGFGIALYGADKMDDAVRAFSRASDLNPADPLPLTFMGKACGAVSPQLASQIQDRLRVSLSRNRDNADLNYDLAACLLKFNEPDPSPSVGDHIESLLKRALTIRPNDSDAYLELGNLYASEHRYQDSIEQYERAAKLNPDSSNIHYRLGQALARSGNKAEANQQFAIFQRLLKSETGAANKHQSEIQQFVYTMRRDHANQSQ